MAVATPTFTGFRPEAIQFLVELAANKSGQILGLRCTVWAGMGAYLSTAAPGIPTILHGLMLSGPYQVPAVKEDVYGVYTNTTPVDAYRGAGRPEATQAIERAIDALARRVGKDVVEIRRMNFMPPFTEATQSIGGLMIDSGNYPATLDKALGLFDYEQLRKEQQARRDNEDTKQLGIGFSTYLENCGWGPSRVIGGILKYAGGGWEAATVRCHPTGKVVAVIGNTPHGQGNETTFAQVVGDDLGVPIEDVEGVLVAYRRKVEIFRRRQRVLLLQLQHEAGLASWIARCALEHAARVRDLVVLHERFRERSDVRGREVVAP